MRRRIWFFFPKKTRKGFQRKALRQELFSLEPFTGNWLCVNARNLERGEIMSAAAKTSVLRNVGTATIPASETPFDPHAALVAQPGLYVYGSFIENVRSRARPVESMGALALPYSDLEQDAYDREITAALGDKYEFSETETCYIIDRLVSRQPNGESGVLLNNGYANLIYVRGGPVVRVGWDSGRRKWDVNVWHRDVGRWSRGDRAFAFDCN